MLGQELFLYAGAAAAVLVYACLHDLPIYRVWFALPPLSILLQARVHVCRAKDPSARLVSAWRLVQVQQQYAVTLTLPLTLPASDPTEAQTRADAIMTGSNATGALATALSAGLIAGQAALQCPPPYAVVCLFGLQLQVA